MQKSHGMYTNQPNPTRILCYLTVGKDQLIAGGCYFIVTYSDSALRYPQIETLVFVGLNVLPDDLERDQVWYFQDPDSYCEFGKFFLSDDKERFKVTTMREETLELVLDFDGLAVEFK